MEKKVAQKIGNVVAVFVHTAHIDIVQPIVYLVILPEIGIGNKRVAAPVRDGVLENFRRLLQRQLPAFKVLLEVRPQELVGSANHWRRLRLFVDFAHVDKVYGLDGLVEGARRVLRDPLADPGNLQQFLLSDGILRFLCQVAGKFGISMGIRNGCLTGND